jgi:uncharacterized protein YcfL
MKKLTYLALMGLTCVLVACGGNTETETTEETQTTTDTTVVTTDSTAVVDTTAVVE